MSAKLRLRIENPHPVPGGRLAADVFLPPVTSDTTVTAELSCWRIDALSKPLEQLWSGRQRVDTRPNARGAIAKIAIDIPAGLPRTALPDSHASAGQPVKWELRLKAQGEDSSLQDSYQVLVGAEPGGAGAPDTGAAAPAPLPDASSLWVLVAANLVPIAGVLYWGWRVQDVVYLYWIENLVIGAFAILRILAATPDAMQFFRGGVMREHSGWQLLLGKLVFSALFVVHYGGFCLVHGIFLTSLFPPEPGAHDTPLGIVARYLHDEHTLFAIAAIAASHAYSFFRNYLGRGEFRHPDFMQIMTQPYKRVGVTHLFILAAGFLMLAFNLPLAALLIFIAIKIYADARLHRAERRALAPDKP